MTKAQLRAYRDIRKERDRLLAMISELEAILYGPRSSKIDGMPRSRAKVDNGQLEAQMERHAKLRALYEEKVQNLAAQMHVIEGAIDALPSKMRTLCRLYYIEGKTWDQVGADMGYSWSQVHRIHGEALQMLRRDETHGNDE